MTIYEKEKIKNQLIRWGYLRHRVEQMKPWTLLSYYRLEKDKRNKDFYPTEYSYHKEASFVHSSILSEMWTNNLVRSTRQKMGGKK